MYNNSKLTLSVQFDQIRLARLIFSCSYVCIARSEFFNLIFFFPFVWLRLALLHLHFVRTPRTLTFQYIFAFFPYLGFLQVTFFVWLKFVFHFRFHFFSISLSLSIFVPLQYMFLFWTQTTIYLFLFYPLFFSFNFPIHFLFAYSFLQSWS